MDRKNFVKASYEFRWAYEDEWAPAMKMIWKTFLRFEGNDYTEEGIRNFFDFISDDDLYVSFLRGDYRLMVALDKGKIIGAGSLREGNRLSLLFVDEAYHRRGVGKTLLEALCTYLKTETGARKMSLKAAPYAVDFYKKMGFCPTRNTEEEYAGIRVTSMEKIF